MTHLECGNFGTINEEPHFHFNKECVWRHAHYLLVCSLKREMQKLNRLFWLTHTVGHDRVLMFSVEHNCRCCVRMHASNPRE